MKEIIALAVFFLITGTAVFLAVKKQTANSLTAVLLVFALVSGLAVANYDWMSRVQWHVPGLEPFENQVSEIKSIAIEDLCQEIESRRETLNTVLSTADETEESLTVQRRTLESLLETASRAQAALSTDEQRIGELNDRTAELERQIVETHRASGRLALAMTRLIWLLLEAREEYGAERTEMATQQIMDEMDAIVSIVIVDPKARADFVNEVMSSLPPRQR